MNEGKPDQLFTPAPFQGEPVLNIVFEGGQGITVRWGAPDEFDPERAPLECMERIQAHLKDPTLGRLVLYDVRFGGPVPLSQAALHRVMFVQLADYLGDRAPVQRGQREKLAIARGGLPRS